MAEKKFTCYMNYKGLPCIKATSPNPKDVDCNACLWNMKNTRGGSMATMEKLFTRYKAKNT